MILEELEDDCGQLRSCLQLRAAAHLQQLSCKLVEGAGVAVLVAPLR